MKLIIYTPYIFIVTMLIGSGIILFFTFSITALSNCDDYKTAYYGLLFGIVIILLNLLLNIIDEEK